ARRPARAAGGRLAHRRLVAQAFNDSGDLVEDHAPAVPVDVAPWDHELAALLDEVDALVAMRDHCVDESDRFYDQLGRFEVWARRVRQAPDDVARLALLREEAGRPRRKPNGQKGNWPTCELGELKQRYTDLQAKLDALRDRIAHEAVRRLAVELRRFTLEAAAERRAAGELEFHDLLVLARHVLRDPTHGPAVRRALHRRYRHLLIDEFQDIDPIQVDLAVLIASTDHVEPGAQWHEVATREGHLFFVGDPKQSIYRFRRADISLFLRAAERFGDGGRRVSLTTNFRTGRSIVELVNEVFGTL